MFSFSPVAFRSRILGIVINILLVQRICAQLDYFTLVDEHEDKGYVTSGAFREDLPSPIFYETFAPLLFTFKTPKWNKADVTFNNWYTCITETAPFRYSCPVVFHMNKAVLNLHLDFDRLTPAEEYSDNFDFYSKLTEHSEFCDKIQKHFSGSYIRSNELNYYAERLNSCRMEFSTNGTFSMNSNKTATTSPPDFTYSIRDPFMKMENNFFHTFYTRILNMNNSTTNYTTPQNIPSVNIAASALLSNSRMILQSTLLSFYYAEKSRWTNAEMSCSRQVIPQSLINKNYFLKNLLLIQNLTTIQSGHDLSVGSESLSKYYQLPITDCTHTNDSFIVRVLVPIVKRLRGKSFQLVQLHNTPFHYRDHLCKIQLEDGPFYIYNEMSNSAYPTECKANELCSISDYGILSQMRDPCASAIISHNNSGIRSHCQFKCLPVVIDSSTVQPYIVQRISSNKYVITKSFNNPTPITSVIIKCQQMQMLGTKLMTIEDSRPGSWMITLPCLCQIVLPGAQKLYGDPPCGDGGGNETLAKLDWIIPLHFTKSVVETLWEDDAVTLENTMDGQEHRLVHLSTLIDDDLISNYIGKNKNLPADIIKSAKKLSGEPGEGKWDNSHSESSGHIYLWVTLVLSTVVILSIQVFIINELRRLKQISYPKCDKILYHVPDSPVAHHL